LPQSLGAFPHMLNRGVEAHSIAVQRCGHS
jgi:hypothetical protein